MNYEEFYTALNDCEPSINWKEKMMGNYTTFKKRRRMHKIIAGSLLVLTILNLVTLFSVTKKENTKNDLNLIVKNIFINPDRQ